MPLTTPAKRERCHPCCSVSPWIGPKRSKSSEIQYLLQKLPEDVSPHDFAREIEFVAAVRQGGAEIERGDRIPTAEIGRELPSSVFR